MKTKVVQHQTLTDIALAATGDARGVIALAVANGRSITAALSPGEDINRDGVLNVDVVTFFNGSPAPATAEPQQLEYEAATPTPFISFANTNRSTTLTVIEGQSTFDLAVQASGSITGLIELLVKNGIQMTTPPEVGLVLKKPALQNASVEAFYKGRGHKPATAFKPECVYAECDYVEFGYWE